MNVKLLREIQLHILTESHRFDMSNWFDTRDAVAPCHTTGCIAGWALALDLQKRKAISWKSAIASLERKEQDMDDKFNASVEARRLLRITEEDSQALFHVDYWPEPYKAEYEDLKDQFMGAKKPRAKAIRSAQAALTVARIEHFIAFGV